MAEWMSSSSSAQTPRDRTTYLGGSEIGAISGVSPYSDEWDVYAAKMGTRVEPSWHPWLEWGQRLEPIIMNAWAERHRATLHKGSFIQHPTIPYLGGTPDRIVSYAEEMPIPVFGYGVLEGKTADSREGWRWGADGSTEVPPSYELQLQWYLGLLGLSWGSIPVLIGGSDFRVYFFEADPECYAAMVDLAARWWTKHIIGGEPPAMNGSTAAKAFLQKRHPRSSEKLLASGPNTDGMMVALRDAMRVQAKATAEREQLENEFRAIIADDQGIEGPVGRITWKSAKNGNRSLLKRWTKQEATDDDRSEAADQSE